MLRVFNRGLRLHSVWRGEPAAGSPPPLLLLHGLFGSSSNFRSPGLQLAKDGRRPVLLADLRNHGNSPWSDDCSLESMAEDVVDTLDAMGLEQVTICGHSLGGKVAMAAALKAPQRRAREVLHVCEASTEHAHRPPAMQARHTGAWQVHVHARRRGGACSRETPALHGRCTCTRVAQTARA